MPAMHSQLSSPYIFLFLGVISFSVGVISTCTGVTWVRFGRVIYRAKEPKQFWEDVATSYIIAVCFFGYFLYVIN